MSKKVVATLVPIVLLVVFLLPAQRTLAVAATPSGSTATDTAGEPSADVPTSYLGSQQIQDIKTIIGKNTPSFLSTPIIWVVNVLEDFRKNGFNNVFIFYSLFFVILFVVVRSIFRFFF